MTAEDRRKPTGWHWQITPEQIAKLKANDRETVNKVYFDNYAKFERIAKNYCAAICRADWWQDCLQQVYIDLPHYNYDNTNSLYLSLKRSFRYVCGLPNGVPYQNIVSLNTVIAYSNGDEKRTLADMIPAPEINCEEREEDERRVLEIIAAQTQLTDFARDNLTAFAFACRVYKGLFAYEYAEKFTG